MSTSIELQTPRSGVSTTALTQMQESEINDSDSSNRHEFSLAPADRGKDAWLFLAASFTLEALVWGFPFAFGVFQNYYSTHPPFEGSSQIAVIGTCAMVCFFFLLESSGKLPLMMMIFLGTYVP